MTPHIVVRRARPALAASSSSGQLARAGCPQTASGAPIVLTNDEAAAPLHIGHTTLYQLVWDGTLTPLRIGRSVRFTRDQLEEFVKGLHDGK